MIRRRIKQSKEDDDEESSGAERWRISCDGAKNR